MKKLLLLSLMIATPVFADNSARIKELDSKALELSNQYQVGQAQLEKIKTDVIKISGAIEELKNQDEAENISKVLKPIEDANKK